jgi:hypothetical protein
MTVKMRMRMRVMKLDSTTALTDILVMELCLLSFVIIRRSFHLVLQYFNHDKAEAMRWEHERGMWGKCDYDPVFTQSLWI